MEPGSDPALTDRRLEGLEGEELIERGRDLAAQPLEGRELVGEAVAAVGFLACAVAMALFLDAERSLSIPLACVLVAAHVVAARIKFEVGAGFTVPTQLVLVPMLFLLPTPLVPLFVAFGEPPGRPARLSARQAPPAARDHRVRGLVVLARSRAACSSRSARRRRAVEDWPVYVAALVAQAALDFFVTSLREWFELGRNPLIVLRDWAWITAVDALLAPIALLAMFTSLDDAFSLLARPAGRRAALHLRPRAPARAQQRAPAAQRVPRARRSCSAT